MRRVCLPPHCDQLNHPIKCASGSVLGWAHLTEIVSQIADLKQRLPGPSALVLNKTGVGAPVADLFLHAGLSPLPICIIGGHCAHWQGRTP